MKKYGFINNLGELKMIQNSIYKGSGNFVGITRNGWAYIYTGTEPRKLTKEEVRQILNLTPDQVESVIRSRGKVDFGSSIGNSEDVFLTQPIIEKFEKTQQVRADIKDTQKGREKNHAKASVDDSNKVKKEQLQEEIPVSLDKSKLRSLSLKNQVKYLRNRIEWLEENYVSKEQMIEIMQAILQEK